MIGWVDTPPFFPFRCPLTLRDKPEDGPYYSTGMRYFASQATDAGEQPTGLPSALFLSPQAIREACAAEGSPLVVHDRAEHQARLDYIADLERDLEETRAALEEAQDENSRLTAAPAVDVQALADALVVPLNTHFAKKAGRPRKDAA